MNKNISIYEAALCRDLVEGGNGMKYFGSLMGFKDHQNDAVRHNLISLDGGLTSLGRALGVACKDIPNGRAYGYAELYRQAIAYAQLPAKGI